jgi:multiple sugar transport system substrate-binding protein
MSIAAIANDARAHRPQSSRPAFQPALSPSAQAAGSLTHNAHPCYREPVGFSVKNRTEPRTRRALLASILLLCATIALPPACSPRTQPPERKAEIRFCFWGGFLELKLWEQLKALYERRYPDTTLHLDYAPGEYHRKLRLNLIAGTAADVIMVDDEFYPTYSKSGNLELLDPYIERDKDELHLDDFLPTSLESFTYEGKHFALPWDGFSVVIFYNCDIFDAADIPYPEDDWTWDDLRRLAIALTKDFDNDGRIDQFGFNITFTWRDAEPIIWSYGGRILTPDKKRFAMNTPETIAALQYLHDLKFKHHTIPQAGELSGMFGEIQILTGRVGMLMAPAYMMTNMRGVEAMRWDIVHMPTGPEGKATRLSWDGLAVYPGSRHKEQAWRFIKTVLSDEGQRIVAKLERDLPVRRSAALDAYVDAAVPQRIEKFFEAIEYGRLTPITVKYAEIDFAMQLEFDRFSLGKIDAATLVKNLEPEINRILSEETS